MGSMPLTQMANGLTELASPKGLFDQANLSNKWTRGTKLTENIRASKGGNQPSRTQRKNFRTEGGSSTGVVSAFSHVPILASQVQL